MTNKIEQLQITDIVPTTHEHTRVIGISGVRDCSDRFWAKVSREPGQGPGGKCWEWQACRLPSGYGRFAIGPSTYYSHRVAYELSHGPLGPGQSVMHSCDNPPCCRGEHLSAGTAKDNMQDAARKGRMARLTGDANGRRRKAAPVHTAVREAAAKSRLTQRELAIQFGLSQPQIARILKGGSPSD